MRDQGLETFLRSVQLLAGHFEELDDSHLRDACLRLVATTPQGANDVGGWIVRSALAQVAVRVGCRPSRPPNVKLILSSLQLMHPQDVSSVRERFQNCVNLISAPGQTLEDVQVDPRVAQALLMIRSQFVHPNLTLSTVAAEVNLSPWHLDKLLARDSHASFRRHLEDCRLDHAIGLLKSSFLRIKQIAVSSGFGSTATFERAFRRRMGLSPTQWRSHH